MTDVEIVKKGYLKNQFKDSKSSWFVFKIGSSTSGHILDIFHTERESSKKNPVPRDRIYLREIQSVNASGHDSPNQFCLASVDGAIQYMLEAMTELECNEWVFALNAVLFGKGFNGRNLIQFAIHINKCPQFGYHGHGILEVREDTLLVWSQGESEEVVRWKLGHLRSFKAKVGVLEIIAGSRSSTGEGVFMFGTQQSVLITHTLETVIDRLARMKRLKNMKLQQALPPLPFSNPSAGTFSPSNPFPGQFPPLNSPVASSMPGNNVTLVRGRTDTKNLIPSFSDIPDSSVKVQPNRTSQHQHKSSASIVSTTYDTLHAGRNTNTRNSCSLGTLSLPRRDIYSDVDNTTNIKRASHLSMKEFDYSYVETEPKCVLVSPTEDKHAIGFGEVRHLSSSSMTSKNSSGHPTVVTSDYYGCDDTYSSLQPVNLMSDLPQGLYNQLDFKQETNDQDFASESPPPPLPPPLFPSLPPSLPPPASTKKGYVNVGSRSPRTSEGSQGGLSDSVGSLEFTLELSDSPKFTKKGKSPKPSPRQSPCQSPVTSPKFHCQLSDQTASNKSSGVYNRVSRDENKQSSKLFDIDSTDNGGYSKLTARCQKEEIQVNSQFVVLSHETGDDSPYAQLSRTVPPTNTSYSDYDQLSTSRVTQSDQSEGAYSKFSHSTSNHPNYNKTPIQYGSDIYSTFQSPGSSDDLVENGRKPGVFQSYDEIQSFQSAPLGNKKNDSSANVTPIAHLNYEEIKPFYQTDKENLINTNHYDEVTFNETDTTSGSNLESFLGSSIYEDDPPGIQTYPNSLPDSQNQNQSMSLDVPPPPPQRGVSIKKKLPPPIPAKPKPKPYVPKR